MTENPVIAGLDVFLENSRNTQEHGPERCSCCVHLYKRCTQERQRCKLAEILSGIADERLSAMVGQRETWTAARLSRVLGLMGQPVSASQIRTHRRGECVCYEEANAA